MRTYRRGKGGSSKTSHPLACEEKGLIVKARIWDMRAWHAKVKKKKEQRFPLYSSPGPPFGVDCKSGRPRVCEIKCRSQMNPFEFNLARLAVSFVLGPRGFFVPLQIICTVEDRKERVKEECVYSVPFCSFDHRSHNQQRGLSFLLLKCWMG